MKRLRIVVILSILLLSFGMLTITLTAAGFTAGNYPHHASLVNAFNFQNDVKDLKSTEVKDPAVTDPDTGGTTYKPGSVTCPASGLFYSEDFEASDGGYTHGGTADEWEWGKPTTSPPDGAYSGSNVWGTDLDDKYEPHSSQVLTSTLIDLSVAPAGKTLFLNWWQSWRIEGGVLDTASTEIRIGGGPWTQVWTHVGGPMAVPWTLLSTDVSAAAGTTLQVRWHLKSDGSIQLAGLYVDDITVRGDCVNLEDSTKKGPSSINYSEVITYTIMLTNTGSIDAVGAVLSDTIPTKTTYVAGSLSCSTGVCSYDDGASKINWSGVISQSLPSTPLVAVTFAVIPNTSACYGETISNSAWVDHDAIGDGPVELGPMATVCQGGPSIVLKKTVGTDPNICATTDSITVTVGTAVTYCYEVTNTGTVSLTKHDLVDNQLGTILSGFAFDLGPGNSTFVTATTTITQATINTATWTAADSFGGSASNLDSASVTTATQWFIYIPIVTKSSTTAAAGLSSD